MSIGERLQSWFVKEGQRQVVRWLPDATPNVAVAERSYVRVWLAEMFLGKSRRWFTDYQPAVHGQSKLTFADRSIELAKVAAPSAELYRNGGASLSNYILLDQVPFRGGTIEIETALVAMRGQDYLELAIGIAADTARLVAPPIGAALELASKVKTVIGRLFDAGGEIHLAYHNTFTAAAGANQLRGGYIAVVLADRKAISADRLAVHDDQLCIDREPLVGYDHMLLRIEVTDERDDLHNFTDIANLRDAAIQAFVQGDLATGEAYLKFAIVKAVTHPELVNADRRRLAAALRDDTASYRAVARSAAKGASTWAELVANLPSARNNAPVTVDEVLAAEG